MNRGRPPELLQRIRMLMDYARRGTRRPDPRRHGKTVGPAGDMIEAVARLRLRSKKRIRRRTRRRVSATSARELLGHPLPVMERSAT